MGNHTLELKLAIFLLLNDNLGGTVSRVAILVGKGVLQSYTLHVGECFLDTWHLGNGMVRVMETLLNCDHESTAL